MNYPEWQTTVPEEIKADSLWKMTAYRLALFLSDLCWRDVTKLFRDKRTLELSDQLYRSTGSVSANLAEGYSRGTGRDRARFYEYALGSARESRDWYFKGRFVLGPKVSNHRIKLLSEIIRLLLTMVPQQRGSRVAEAPAPYVTAQDVGSSEKSIEDLISNVPLPD